MIVYYLEDISRVAEILEREFEIDVANSRDVASGREPDQFGYASVHYVLTVGENRRQLGEWAPYRGRRAEIQIRTVLQHAWAAIDHKLRYKSAQEVPRHLRRDLFRLSALLELADKEFSDLRRVSHDVAERYLERVGQGDLDIEIDSSSLEAYFGEGNEATYWQRVAEEVGFMGVADYSRSLQATDRADLVRLASTLGVNSIGSLDATLRGMRTSGRDTLARIVAESKARGYVPRAVPYDVIGMLLLVAYRDEGRAAIGTVPYRGEVAAALTAVLASV